MVKATQSYHKRDLHRVVAAQITMARYLARQAIKAQLRAKGQRPGYTVSVAISRAARVYLIEHWAELIQEAQAQLSGRFLLNYEHSPICDPNNARLIQL